MGHVTGNINSRHAAAAFHEHGLLHQFHTSVVWPNRYKRFETLIPGSFLDALHKRSFPDVPDRKIRGHPIFELLRLLTPDRFRNLRPSVKTINRHFDAKMAKSVFQLPAGSSVYGYFDTSLETFRAARSKGIRTIYELPTTYWRKVREILSSNPARFPRWESSHPDLLEDSDVAQQRDKELELADLVIVPSHFVQASLKLAPSLNARIELVPYGCPQSKSSISMESSASSALKILFVGNLSADKGLPDLLEAVAAVAPQVTLTVIGSFIDEATSSNELLQQQLLKHRFLGKISHEDVLKEMSENEVLVLPSYHEGLALVILEAMSAGLAIITSPNSGAQHIVRDGQQGFVVPAGSPTAIASALLMLQSDRNLLFKLRKEAYTTSQSWTWPEYKRRLIQAII